MDDREKIIEGLKELHSHFRALAGIASSKQTRTNHVESAKILHDALALLNELDVSPEELERLKFCRYECKIDCLLEHYNRVVEERDELMKVKVPVLPGQEHSGGGTTWWYVCGFCGTAINPNDKYCHECGRPVKWE